MTSLANPYEPTYRACHARAFRAEFGVCRGESISRFEDLSLGDIYQLKQDIDWMPVRPADAAATAFTFERAANLPVRNLTTLAHLIFMSTTGRRADVHAAFCDGQLYLVCETEIRIGTEYVLIDVAICDVDFTPALVHAPVAPMLEPLRETAEVIPFRMIG